MDEALELEDIDAAYCLLFLREVRDAAFAMVDEQLRADVMNDIVLLKIVGVNPVIVHGGGKAITEAMDFLQLPVEFKDGQRVTTPEAMDLVRTVLMGKVNQELVEALNEHGNFAVGVSGADAGVIVAEQASQIGRAHV